MNTKKIIYQNIFFLILYFSPISAQDRTVGLFINDSASFNGYSLFAPLAYINTYLINNEGRLVHLWEGDHRPGLSAYLLENGNLLRTAFIPNQIFLGGGSGGLIQEYNWEGDQLWEYEYSSNDYYQHHDVERLPNGNTLIIAWERKSFEEAITAGRNPALMSQGELWPDHIIEVQPNGSNGGDIVWEWHVWDHLIQDYDSSQLNYGVVSEHPELININFVSNLPNSLGADWNHINAVDYNAELDQIILSVHHFGEVWIVDHSTTSQEASGHTGGNHGMGGDLLYRWGNPRAYQRGDAADQKLFGQHDSHWIEAGLPGEGNILIFNNGRNRPGGDYSTIDEFVPPIDQNGNYPLNADSTYGPVDFIWTYSDPIPFDFFSPNVSGSQRQPNGNTLVCSGTWGRFFEVTNLGELVWLYINPVIASGPMYYEDPIPGTQNWTFRVYRYTVDYPGLDGRDLTPGDPIELYTTDAKSFIGSSPSKFKLYQNFPNPFNPSTKIKFTIPVAGLPNVEPLTRVILTVYDVLGNKVATLVNKELAEGEYEVEFSARGGSAFGGNVSSLPNGVYFYQLRAGEFIQTKKMLLIK